MIFELTAYCLTSLPYEACGLILGSKESATAERFVMVNNVSARPMHQFIMDPHELTYLLYNTKEDIIGIFHSHPSQLAVPSEDDLLTLWHCVPSHWIISLMQPGRPLLKVYKLKQDRRSFEEAELHLY